MKGYMLQRRGGQAASTGEHRGSKAIPHLPPFLDVEPQQRAPMLQAPSTVT